MIIIGNGLRSVDSAPEIAEALERAGNELARVPELGRLPLMNVELSLAEFYRNPNSSISLPSLRRLADAVWAIRPHATRLRINRVNTPHFAPELHTASYLHNDAVKSASVNAQTIEIAANPDPTEMVVVGGHSTAVINGSFSVSWDEASVIPGRPFGEQKDNWFTSRLPDYAQQLVAEADGVLLGTNGDLIRWHRDPTAWPIGEYVVEQATEGSLYSFAGNSPHRSANPLEVGRTALTIFSWEES